MGNPLLRPAFPIPFHEVKPEHVQPAVDELLADAALEMQAVIDQAEPRTFANTMLALEQVTHRLEYAMRVVGHLEAVTSSEALRAAYNEAQPRVSEFCCRIPLSSELWAAVKSYAATDEAKALEGPRRRYLDKTVSYFKRHGAELDEAGKTRMAEIDVELTQHTLRYSQNVLDETARWELLVTDESKLAGLPDSARNGARESASGKGLEGWRFTLTAPSFVPVLMYLDDRAIREKLYRALSSRATSGKHDNAPLIDSILRLRREKASLIGYRTFADFVTEERMAEKGEKARSFIDALRATTQAHFAEETAQLEAFRRDLEGDDAAPLAPWDVGYYSEKLRQQRYAFDEEALRPYFSFERVLSGLFTIAGKLYGVRFEPWDEAPVWEKSVRAFRVLEGDKWLAAILIDPFPRETKQQGAWMDGLLSRARGEEDERSVGVMVANVTPPIGGAEAQLSFQEVETMFHEFGHLMHHCLSDTELRSQAGTHVAWDFVELPSQMFENWCWEREALDLFALHGETGEPIPEELLEPKRRTRTFRAASQQMRQLGLATVDLTLHSQYDPERDGDVIAFCKQTLQPFNAAPLPDGYAMIASFDHLFGSPVGYAAGYYSYKWAEVLDADAFTRFKSSGLLSAEVGRSFRNEVLARGDERAPEELFRAFMGRDPDQRALLERLGLA